MEPEINNCSEVKRQQSEILYNEIVFNFKKTTGTSQRFS